MKQTTVACTPSRKIVHSLGGIAVCLLAVTFCLHAAGSQPSSGAYTARPAFDPNRLPAALQDVPLDQLSSGALIRLDRDGDLVESPAAWAARTRQLLEEDARRAKPAVALDPRVGANIRLGDDPPELPPGRRAQAEPHIARDPGDPDFLLATFQEGREQTGGAADCGYAVSHDGGLTWRRALIPGLARPSGGTFDVSSDPVAAIGLDSNAYLNTLGVMNTGALQGTALVSRSADRGETWGSPVVVYRSPDNAFFPDKNWIAANTFRGTSTAGRVVVTFTLISNTGSSARPIARVFSDDAGQTWSALGFIHDPTTESQGSQPAFLPDGRLAVAYWNFNRTPSILDDFLELVISNDGGTTFTAPKFITNVAFYDHPLIRDSVVLPSMTVSRGSGEIFIAYQARDIRRPFTGAPPPRIMFTKSSNAGDTWTAPVPISDNPVGSPVINPAVAVSPDGQTVTVMFYDARDNPDSSTHLDIYLAQSFDGGTTWQPNMRLTPVSTNAALAPMSGAQATPQNPNYMLGDYQGMAEPTNPNVPAVPIWIDTRTGNPDPFVARVGIAPAVNFTAWQAARLSLAQINDPATGGEAGDADNDGEDNLSEYRSGTDPLSVFRSGRLLNISTRARVQTGDRILIGGFIITGDEPKQVIVRAIGPSTGPLGVEDPLQDPTLELFDGDGLSLAANDDWRDTQGADIENSGLAPTDEREAATIQTLSPGHYTTAVRGKNNSMGVALVEVFDLASGTSVQLANISTRSFVDTDENVMIGGFIIGAGQGTAGAGSARVLIRGIGPSLAREDIVDVLQDPELLLFNQNGEILAPNDDWRQTQESEIQETGIPPLDDREPAVFAALAHGNYTAIVRGKERATGVALIEVYRLAQ
jgi:hypothetical protein